MTTGENNVATTPEAEAMELKSSGSHASGAVPAAPGNTATIPGDLRETPLLVTVCSK